MAIEIIGRLTAFTDTKSNCETANGILGEIQFARATDTGELGVNFGAGWRWYPTGTASVPVGGSGNTLLIYDDATFKVTGTAINFGSNLNVSVTGSVAFVDATGGGSLTVKELDGSPSVANVTEIKVTNGKLTDNGGGSVSIDISVTGSSASSTDGWTAAGETWTFGSKDGPTYTFYTNIDVTQTYSPGMRLKATQGGIVNYFIVTKTAYASTTGTVTAYGGTDYSLTGTSISSPYYSIAKAPFGFPLDPLKWSVVVTDTSQRTQVPSVGTWYNMASLNIVVPIGSWLVSYNCCYMITSNPAALSYGQISLSTANNSESDADFTIYSQFNSVYQSSIVATKEKHLLLASKTTYYLIEKALGIGSTPNLQLENGNHKLLLRAVCAYL